MPPVTIVIQSGLSVHLLPKSILAAELLMVYNVFVTIFDRSGGELVSTGWVEVSVACPGSKEAW